LPYRLTLLLTPRQQIVDGIEKSERRQTSLYGLKESFDRSQFLIADLFE
jgi:hypothetical protein